MYLGKKLHLASLQQRRLKKREKLKNAYYLKGENNFFDSGI